MKKKVVALLGLGLLPVSSVYAEEVKKETKELKAETKGTKTTKEAKEQVGKTVQVPKEKLVVGKNIEIKEGKYYKNSTLITKEWIFNEKEGAWYYLSETGDIVKNAWVGDYYLG